MIQSILDNDLYKFTMQQAVLRLYPEAQAEYRFFNRGGTPFPPGMAEALSPKIMAMAGLSLTPQMRGWLEKTCPYFDAAYLDFLSGYRFSLQEVTLAQNGPDLTLAVRGPWVRTILWEVPLMALVSETYFSLTAPEVLGREQIRERNREKAAFLSRHRVKFADFGTRRRYSFQNHDRLIGDLLSVGGHTLTGTSNVHLAKKWQIPPIGTMAHEWIMFHAILGGYGQANSLAMDAWKQVYPQALGIALTDTYTTAVFLERFDAGRASRFAGVRQDSGDPFAFAPKMVSHYRKLGIDPAQKTIVFSDGLDTRRAAALQEACAGKINAAFGIGTHLTNDIGSEPLNMVIKLVAGRSGRCADWQPTVKLSDDPGKHTGTQEEIRKCLERLNLAS